MRIFTIYDGYMRRVARGDTQAGLLEFAHNHRGTHYLLREPQNAKRIRALRALGRRRALNVTEWHDCLEYRYPVN